MSATFELNFQNKRYTSAYTGFMALADNLKRSTDKLGMPLSIELRRFLKKATHELADRHSRPWPGGTSSNTLSRRSGSFVRDLMNSSTVTGTKLHDVKGEVAIPGHMTIHERGGTITPKKSKYLTIPLKAALRSNGTPIKRSAREWSNTFVATSKKGNLLIFQRRGKEIVPLYVLKTSVKIPPRLGMVSTLEARMPAFIDKVFETLVDELFRL